MKFENIASTSSILALVLATGCIASAPAHAGFKNVDIDKITTQFDDHPTIKLKDSGNGYLLDEYRPATIKMRLRAKVSALDYLTRAEADLNGRVVYALPIKYQPKELDETVSALVSNADLAKFQTDAVSHCDRFGETGKQSKRLIQIPVRFEAVRNNGAETRSDVETFDGYVVCGPKWEQKGMDGLAAADSDFKVRGVAIRLMTSAGKPASPNPGTRCQVTTARVRVETSKPGAVKFKLWSKVGNNSATSQVVDAWSSFTGPGKHEAVFDKKIEVERSSQVQVKAEEMVNVIGLSTEWKLADLDCDGAGGGGLATPGGNANPDSGPAAAPLTVTGNISLGTKPGSGATKPRDAVVSFRLWTNQPGPTSYKLTCTGGNEWNGTVPTVRVASGKYQGHGMEIVHIAKTTKLACAIRSTSISGAPLTATASKDYLVVTRNGDLNGPNQVSTKPKPTHGKKPAADTHEVKTAPVAPKPRPAVRFEKTSGGLTVGKVPATKRRPTGGKEQFDVRKPH